jgi:hypothetical protein
MRVLRWLAAAMLGIGAALGGTSNEAKADWLGLADGTYDVTLTCTSSTLFSCPSQITGTLTIAGAGATFMDFTINGQVFSGDPNEGIHTIPSTVDFEFVDMVNTPFSELGLRRDLSIPNPFVAADHWWFYCNPAPNDANACQPSTLGIWEAALVAAVPEPAALTLLAGGLTALGFARRRRG